MGQYNMRLVSIPCFRKPWFSAWFSASIRSSTSFAERLVAFSCVEGIFFSGRWVLPDNMGGIRFFLPLIFFWATLPEKSLYLYSASAPSSGWKRGGSCLGSHSQTSSSPGMRASTVISRVFYTGEPSPTSDHPFSGEKWFNHPDFLPWNHSITGTKKNLIIWVHQLTAGASELGASARNRERRRRARDRIRVWSPSVRTDRHELGSDEPVRAICGRPSAGEDRSPGPFTNPFFALPLDGGILTLFSVIYAVFAGLSEEVQRGEPVRMDGVHILTVSFSSLWLSNSGPGGEKATEIKIPCPFAGTVVDFDE